MPITNTGWTAFLGYAKLYVRWMFLQWEASTVWAQVLFVLEPRTVLRSVFVNDTCCQQLRRCVCGRRAV